MAVICSDTVELSNAATTNPKYLAEPPDGVMDAGSALAAPDDVVVWTSGKPGTASVESLIRKQTQFSASPALQLMFKESEPVDVRVIMNHVTAVPPLACVVAQLAPPAPSLIVGLPSDAPNKTSKPPVPAGNVTVWLVRLPLLPPEERATM